MPLGVHSWLDGSSMASDQNTKARKVSEISDLLSEKRFAEALTRSTALTRDEPENVEGWWRLTLAAKGLKHWEEAQNAVKEAIKLVPRSPMLWSAYGDICEALKGIAKPAKLSK